MKYVAALTMLTLALTCGPPVHAQQTADDNSCTRAWEARDGAVVKGIEPTVSVRRYAAFMSDCDVISIYFRYSNWDKGSDNTQPSVYHFARLVHVDNGRPTERWADSRKCPALRDAVKSLAAIEPPAISIPGHLPAPTRPITIQLDGEGFRLHNVLGPEFRGDQSSPLGKWTYAALADLTPCWSDQQPSIN